MIDAVPWYISAAFLLTTFTTVGIFLYAVKRTGDTGFATRSLIFLTTFWMVFTAILAVTDFYKVTEQFPPRIFLFAALPALLVCVGYALFFPSLFADRSTLRLLTLLHVIRIPVELVLFGLFTHGQIPEVMTFEGLNFDILSGLTAPLAAYFGFRDGKVHKRLLIAWNIVALALLVNIVSIAIMSFPSPMQSLAFEQPNRAVMYFPYIWLPAIVVPIVFFSHLLSLVTLFRSRPH